MLARTASTLGLMLALGAAPAAASVIVSIPAGPAVPPVVALPPSATTYAFVGQCSDCSGSGGAELMLQNYTLGSPISSNNFVSFHYDGTNLLSAFTITSSNVTSVGGSFTGPLPAPEDFYIFGSGMYFQSQNNGYWCTGGACLSDYGTASQWSTVTALPVPEPISASLLGTGLCAAFILRRRRA